MTFRSSMVGMIEDDDREYDESDQTFVKAEKRKSRMEEEAEGSLGPEAIVAGAILVGVVTLATAAYYIFFVEESPEL
eukprot:CAMPEP_0185731074 /NCGR_PEP_ID=MMETSP1171-20130828/11830_1 /TAXON_ID=374046 /ORGANISM="Helicotheca tamensis, Strain CCMP826" /LENGTH=76 /DNA_ID=CAMNT_0028400257 /DNA_START=169 /DNA_END=399 /DNA_ORIENTATION=+